MTKAATAEERANRERMRALLDGPMTLSQSVVENAARMGVRLPKVRCPHCNGHGWAPLAPHLQQTYDALSDQPQIVSEIAQATGQSMPALNYRLNLLAGLGWARIAGYRSPDPTAHCKPAAEWVRIEVPEERQP